MPLADASQDEANALSAARTLGAKSRFNQSFVYQIILKCGGSELERSPDSITLMADMAVTLGSNGPAAKPK